MTGLPWSALAPEREVKPGLSRTRALLARLGNPEERFPAVHVAGTNGKGSVVAFLDSVFRAAGLRVGMYTSPDLGDPTARIRVDGEKIPMGRLTELVSEAALPVEELLAGPGRPTHFEALTAAAFGHFAAERVDLAVVEVGLGGRYDATNCLARPILSLHTNVDQDHIEFFGPGLARAAWEDAGIARLGVPFLTSEDKEDVLAVVAAECRAVGAALCVVDPEDVQPVELGWGKAVWRSRTDPFDLGLFETGLVGAYQARNLALTLAALAELAGGIGLSRDAVREGLAQARWPGRFEVVQTRPWVVLDGAHNPSGARALVAALDRLPRPPGRWTLAFGALRGKMVRIMAEILFPRFDEVVLVASRTERALPPEALAHQARRLAARWRIGAGVGETVAELIRKLGEGDLLVVSGSLTVVGEARRVLVGAP
ncbi:bifunctional folylpolyglutamate synthase/dihydrofolate synthase [Candidatus Bipolaricaulota bacterium]|nr:bifunctional folylpolyglutamate synthase/dihydrofolate synthase [Candidatus Bipolaricaulota bacterium]